MIHKKMISVFVLASLSACGIKINEHENDHPIDTENAPEIKQKNDDIHLEKPEIGIPEVKGPVPEAEDPVLKAPPAPKDQNHQEVLPSKEPNPNIVPKKEPTPSPSPKPTNKPVVLPTATPTVILEKNIPKANGTWNSECVKSEYLGSDSLVLKFDENRLSVIANHFSDEKCTKIADIFRFEKTFVVERSRREFFTLRLELKDVYKTNYVLNKDSGHKLGQEFLRTEFPSDSRAPGSFTKGREEFTSIEVYDNWLFVADGGKAKGEFTNIFAELASRGITTLKKSP